MHFQAPDAIAQGKRAEKEEKMKSYVVSIDRADVQKKNGQITWKNDLSKSEIIQCHENLKELTDKIREIFCKYSKESGVWKEVFTENNPTLENPRYSYSDIKVSVWGTSIDGGLVRVRAQEKFI